MSKPLTKMQCFFLDAIRSSKEEVNPCYLANLYYESIGERRHAASRDSFGQTAAAYRTCRKLAEIGLVEQVVHKSAGGFSYIMFKSKTL